MRSRAFAGRVVVGGSFTTTVDLGGAAVFQAAGTSDVFVAIFPAL